MNAHQRRIKRRLQRRRPMTAADVANALLDHAIRDLLDHGVDAWCDRAGIAADAPDRAEMHRLWSALMDPFYQA